MLQRFSCNIKVRSGSNILVNAMADSSKFYSVIPLKLGCEVHGINLSKDIPQAGKETEYNIQSEYQLLTYMKVKHLLYILYICFITHSSVTPFIPLFVILLSASFLGL